MMPIPICTCEPTIPGYYIMISPGPPTQVVVAHRDRLCGYTAIIGATLGGETAWFLPFVFKLHQNSWNWRCANDEVIQAAVRHVEHMTRMQTLNTK